MGINKPALIELHSITIQCVELMKNRSQYSQEEFDKILQPIAKRLDELKVVTSSDKEAKL